MKIAIDARMYGMENGGIGRYIARIVDELSKLDKRNAYVLLLRKKYFDSLKLPQNWEKVLVDIRHYSFKEQIFVSRSLNRINPDITHFPHFNVPINYKGKYVLTIHDLLMHKRTGAKATTLPYPMYLIKRLGYKKVFSSAINKANAIIVPTNYVNGELLKAYPYCKDKISVIYEGVDENVYSPNYKRAFSKLNFKKPYFLYVGSVYPHKNVERLIEAITSLNEMHKAKLVIVTPRNVFQERLKEYTKKHNAEKLVYFTGYVEDDLLSALYKNATAFVYPSTEEGFGLPGLESMANNTLVLASDIAVFKEVYKDNAIYFNPLNYSSIEKAMVEALSLAEPEKEKATQKAKKYAEKFSWKVNAEETLKIYQSLTN